MTKKQRNGDTEIVELIFNKKAFHERSEWDASDKEKMMTTNKTEYALDLLTRGVTTLPPPEDIKNLTQDDPVNHPKHYTSHPSGIETIEITRWMNFNLGNSIKYILRSGKKSEDTAIQDLEKAVWYLNDEIKRLKGEYNK